MEDWKWMNSEVGHQLFSPSTQDSEDIDVAPGSMRIQWDERSNLLEWKNPWYSHGPETNDSRSNDQVFCSESAPKTAPTPPSSSASSTAAAEPCGRQHSTHPGLRCDGTRSGQAWTVALSALWGCRDTHGLEAALDLMREVCLGLVPSELAQAFCDFESAISQKRANSTLIFTPSVENLLVSVSANFKREATACLPLHVLQFALEFANLSENGVLCAVSKEFREAAEGDALWRQAYNTRFPKKSEVCGNTEQGGPDAGAGGCSGVSGGGDDGEDYDDGDGGGDGDGDDDDHTATTAARSRESGAQQPAGVKVAGFKHRYKRRLQDPHVGDQVEVAWKGKFRLESFEVYDGTAWWLAQVVGKGERPGYYQVHYPGWEAKWDEWVPRERLRWGNERLAAALEGIAPRKGDSVEMWCQGLHVPGAWLEAVVHKVEKDRLYLGEVLTSGDFWVDAEHVRLIKRGPPGEEGDNDDEVYGDMSEFTRRSILLQALSDAGFTNSGGGGSPWCCSVM